MNALSDVERNFSFWHGTVEEFGRGGRVLPANTVGRDPVWPGVSNVKYAFASMDQGSAGYFALNAARRCAQEGGKSEARVYRVIALEPRSVRRDIESNPEMDVRSRKGFSVVEEVPRQVWFPAMLNSSRAALAMREDGLRTAMLDGVIPLGDKDLSFLMGFDIALSEGRDLGEWYRKREDAMAQERPTRSTAVDDLFGYYGSGGWSTGSSKPIGLDLNF